MRTPDEHDDDLESEVIDGSASETGIETESFPSPEDIEDRENAKPQGLADDQSVEPMDDLSGEGADSL